MILFGNNDAVNLEQLKNLFNSNISNYFNFKDHFKFSAIKIREFILLKIL